jgi:hypothetical protein
MTIPFCMSFLRCFVFWWCLFVFLVRPMAASRLKDRWNIGGPEAIWETSEESCSQAFMLEYTVSNDVRHPHYQIYHKNCQEVHPHADELFASASLELVQPPGDEEHQNVLVVLNPKANDEEEHSAWYHYFLKRPNEKPALEFCVRMSLWTGPNPEGDVEVNFRATDVQVTLEKRESDGKANIRNVQLRHHNLRKVELRLQGGNAGIKCGPGCAGGGDQTTAARQVQNIL